MIKKMILLAIALFTFDANTAAPKCYSTSGNYCAYSGYVEQIYINNTNMILLYFDTPMVEGEWENAGFSASSTTAAAINLDENPSFAKLFYSTALSAQATNRQVYIQMRGTVNSYLKIDRIWLKK